MKPDAYGVWDTQESCWFKRRNKYAWGTKSAAANAWNAARQSVYEDRQFRGYGPRFSEQTRFVTKGLRFVAID